VGSTAEQVIRLDLPSSIQHVYLLDTIVLEILKEIGFDEETTEQISLAVIEAGTNAIKHGNKEDLNKSAHFEFIVQPDKLTVVVQDEGKGFKREEVADPLDPANILKSSGRGIFLMEACMDSVTYEKSGTIVKMVKHKSLAEQK
jgi:serine/threonine-protein kinase RsbW